jgi:hypothetical protein
MILHGGVYFLRRIAKYKLFLWGVAVSKEATSLSDLILGGIPPELISIHTNMSSIFKALLNLLFDCLELIINLQ